MKILILRFSSIGDIILTTPVIRCVKLQIKDCELHYATKKSFHRILQNNPYIDKIHLLEENLSDLVSTLKKEKFDLIIDLHNNLRTSIIKFRLGVRSVSFNKLNIEKWLLVNFKINYLPDIHIVDRYMATARSLGVKNDDKGLDYFIDAVSQVENLPEKFIAFVIGAKFATKRLPNHRIIEICNLISLPVVLLGGKEDMANSARIMEDCNVNIIDLCGKLDLDGSASVVRRASAVITHDTGLMHIAAAFQKKIVSVWGNTVPAFGMYPYLPSKPPGTHVIIENKGLRCRPCSKIGYDKCPLGHFKCMEEVNVNEVVKVVNDFMNEK